MSIHHQTNNGIVEIFIRGQISRDDLFAGFEKMVNDNDLPRGVHILINVTKSSKLPPLAAVERVASILGRSNRKFSKRVAVLVSERVRYGRARQLGAFLERYGTISQPFYDLEAAIAWLEEENN